MFETAIAQLRFAASLASGKPFALWSLEWLIAALRDTRREFGAIGPEGAEVVRGPALDEATRREMQIRRFRAQAKLAARDTEYYGRLFATLGIDPARLRHDELARIPLTPKEAVRDTPDAFVRRGSRPYLRATTTGTTGAPTSICFSEHELRVYFALGAIAALISGDLQDDDIVQLSTSARATLGNTCLAGACAHVGALVNMAGMVDPAQTLGQLAEKRHIPGKRVQVSLLYTYPSYLGELVETGLRLGYRPADFGLKEIAAGGEIVTQGLRARCERLFGPVRFGGGYGMTEIWPFGGDSCEQGHLHFDPAKGLLEVLDPETGTPVLPGQPGVIVATPFPAFRETTLLLRYNTEDMVRPIAGPLTCSRRDQPATTPLLGKQRLSVRHDNGWTFPRDVLEALEAVEEVPLPARFGFWAAPGGVELEVVTRAQSPRVRRAISTALEANGVPVRELHLLDDRSRLRNPYPLRGDLRETTFAGPVRLDWNTVQTETIEVAI
jgi:phenylacetate-coenzyme A ligase PaaK-like adenylate-forming protein